MNAVFDTNILIDALNGVGQADEEYARYDQVFISRITWMEVLVGVSGDSTEVRSFMESYYHVFPLNLAVAEATVQLRRAHRIRLPDAIIWATARVNDAVLVTRNSKDFDPTWEGIRLPYTL